MNRALWLLLGALLAASCAICAVAADEDAISVRDFSVMRRIDAQEDGMLHRVRLTPDILRDAGYRDDIAVFDASGDLVPFVGIHAPDERESGVHTAPVPAFVMPDDGGGRRTMPMDVVVRQSADGQVVEVRGSQGAESETPRLLLDLTAILRDALRDGGAISGGRLELSLSGEESVAAHVNVEASDNLRDWTRVAEREPLMRLVGEGAGVRSNYIDLKDVRRYLVLDVEGSAKIDPSGVSISLFRRSSVPAAMDSLSFEGSRGDDGAFVYDAGASFPAERISFSLQSPGIHDVRIESRRASSDDWRYRAGATLMYVKNESGETRSGPLEGVSSARDRYWRLSAEGSLGRAPVMEISWRPREIVFMAQGAAPYLLVAGAKRDLPTPRLAQSRAMIERALAGYDLRRIEVAASGAPEPVVPHTDETPPDAAKEKDWGRYAVWALLVGGALLLSWMAWSLMQKKTA